MHRCSKILRVIPQPLAKFTAHNRQFLQCLHAWSIASHKHLQHTQPPYRAHHLPPAAASRAAHGCKDLQFFTDTQTHARVARQRHKAEDMWLQRRA